MSATPDNPRSVKLDTPVVCCLACGHAHPAKAWVWTPEDDQHAAVGLCERCHDIALPLRGGCNDRGCLCMDGNPGAAVTTNPPTKKVLSPVNARCSVKGCADKPGYMQAANCRNCGIETHLLLTFGHKTPGSGDGPDCPNCGVRDWHVYR